MIPSLFIRLGYLSFRQIVSALNTHPETNIRPDISCLFHNHRLLCLLGAKLILREPLHQYLV